MKTIYTIFVIAGWSWTVVFAGWIAVMVMKQRRDREENAQENAKEQST